MWMQIVKGRLKDGTQAQFAQLAEQLQRIEQPGSGLLRSTSARSQQDPSVVYTFVTFESEQAARAREADPRRQEGLAELRAWMAAVFDGPLEFVDLEIVGEYQGT